MSPVGPGQSPGGGREGKAPGSSENPAFYSTQEGTKSHSSGAFSLGITIHFFSGLAAMMSADIARNL